ncbi:MAG: hypothetical protein K2Q32_05680, partial [Alphaproteobacteria bacterium]|nr:hypothetical protein [Alphaproteobacteria bacterium]
MKVAAYRIDLPTYDPRNLSKLPETLYHCRQHFVEVFYNARALLEVNKPHYQNLLSPQHDMELLFA